MSLLLRAREAPSERGAQVAITHQQVRRVLSELVGSEPEFEVIQKYKSGSVVIRSDPLDGETKHSSVKPRPSSLVKLLVDADLPWGVRSLAVPAVSKNVVEQTYKRIGGINVVARPYFDEVLTRDTLLDWTIEYIRKGEDVSKVPIALISDVLAGLVALHSRGLVHGNLRISRITGEPEKGFALHGAGVPSLSSHYSDLRYVAPERIHNKDAPPTPDADIFAFLSLALDALRPFRNSRDHWALAKLDAQVRWLKDFFTVTQHRPTAQSLHTLLVEGIVPPDARSYDRLYDTFSERKSAFATSFPGSLKRIASMIKSYPETSYAVGNESSVIRLHELIRLDHRDQFPYSSFRASASPRPKELLEMESEIHDFPNSIDQKWTNAIHRAYFGHVMDDAHEQRNAMVELTPQERELQELYLEELSYANEVRAALLTEHSFYSTHGVVEEFEKSGLTIGRREIVVLRRWGRILALPDHDRWLYPRFQFNDGYVSPLVAESHALHRERSGGIDPSPWSELTFFTVRRDTLGGRALKDVLWRPEALDKARHVVRQARV